MHKQRRTKIIATLGPATDNPTLLKQLLQAGVDLVRLNFSHGNVEQHQQRVQWIRELAKDLNKEVGILADLQGPKIRIARFKTAAIELEAGQIFILDADLAEDAGDKHQVGITYKNLVHEVKAGDELVLDDGRLSLWVESIEQHKIHCRVHMGGTLSASKGINKRGGGLSAQALTDKDKIDLQHAVAMGVDYIALSFPRSAEDIHEARQLLRDCGGEQIGIIAKIERAEAILCLDEMIEAADAVMVARGDLGVEMGDAKLPGIQKRIIDQSRLLGKPVITATQMLESMIHSTIPTRAEVSDVANAVLDNTDAVMLSAETASGQYPVLAVEAMDRICREAETLPESFTPKHRLEHDFERVDEAITMATMYIASHLDIAAIIALTESGSTPLWMSRIRTHTPIYALCRHAIIRRRMTLYRGVYPIEFDVTQQARDTLNKQAVWQVERYGFVKQGDLIIMTKGDYEGQRGTNALKLTRVGEIC